MEAIYNLLPNYCLNTQSLLSFKQVLQFFILIILIFTYLSNMAVSHKNLKKTNERPNSRSNPHRNPYCSACANRKCRGCSDNSKHKSKTSLQKLMNAIEAFHNNLCSLPLDMLINSTHP